MPGNGKPGGWQGKIIDHGAWAAQRERIGLKEQQALVGFVKTLDKMGEGFGKKVPALKAQARELLESARSAVPVWIMPLNRVVRVVRSTEYEVRCSDHRRGEPERCHRACRTLSWATAHHRRRQRAGHAGRHRHARR